MTSITHHPSQATLARFAAGELDEACHIVVATHLRLCTGCMREVNDFEQFGGVFLESEKPLPLRTAALTDILARIHEPFDDSEMTNLDFAALRDGNWRWIYRGLWLKPLPAAVQNDTKAFMLKASPGAKLPAHGHKGIEWTCIVEGAYRHDYGRFGPGDFDEADETVEHRPLVESGGSCICIVALQRGIELKSWLGRVVQPLIRI